MLAYSAQPGDGRIVAWTALQNNAVAAWVRDHGRYQVSCDPLAVRNELTADGNVICECERCACGVVLSRRGDQLLSWSDGRPA